MPQQLPTLQDLPRKWARFCLGIESFCADELGCDFSRTSCVAACSGGADSTALLLLAALLCRRKGGQVTTVHLDHGLRAESSADAAFVKELCARLDIPLVAERQDIQALALAKGIGLEEAGRQARYALLERMRQESGAQCILVGHQLNDLAEDQLLRLLRGSGWPALGGMQGYDPERWVLRPFLLTPRSMLEDFVKISGNVWRVDQSNSERAATRNRVRQDLLPALLRENPSYLDSAARLWRQARLDQAHWDAAVAGLLEHLPAPAEGSSCLLPSAMLDASPAPLRLRLYKAVLEQMGQGQPLSDSLLLLDERWRQGARGKRVRFPGDKEARIAASGIVLQVIDRKKECG